MTGMAALAICAAFTSCSKETNVYNPDVIEKNAVQEVYNNYNQAFVKTFGQPAANQDWGFGTAAKARTRTESANANLWGDPNADGGAWNYKVVPPLTPEQKAVVRKYFQTVKNPEYDDPKWTEYFMQQVYKGHTEGQIGVNSPEEYKSADKNNIIGSDKMNHLVAVFPDGTLDHINNFNFGTCSTNDAVLNTGASTNSSDPDDWHSDEIMLMQNSTTNAFGYYNSDGSIYRTNYTGLVGFQTIIDELGAEANCLNDGWNRSFMGFDFEQMISGEIETDVQPTWSAIPGFNDMYWAWDEDENGNDIYTRIKDQGTEATGWAPTFYEGYGNDDPIIEDLYYLNSDMNMYCGEYSEITDDGVFYVYKDVDENNKNQKCLNLKYIRDLVNSGSYPVSGGAFKKWVKLGGCADGYYSDWIVCLTEAKKQDEVTPTPQYTVGVIGEDLSSAEDGDFDFNDVVFNVAFNIPGKTYIKLRAAGGTLPLIIGIENPDDNQSYTDNEVHNIFGNYSTNTMINTGASAYGASADGVAEAVLVLDKTYTNAKFIPVYVKKNGHWIELTAERGTPASKIGVSPNFRIVPEQVFIGSEGQYPLFTKWVTENTDDVSNWEGVSVNQ